MREIFSVCIGGLIGSLLRYGTVLLVFRTMGPTGFPVGTFIVNIAGCFLIGVFAALSDYYNWSLSMKLFLITGLLGGFTTFSAFAFETLALLKTGSLTLATLNVCSSVTLGIFFVYAGIKVARIVFLNI